MKQGEGEAMQVTRANKLTVEVVKTTSEVKEASDTRRNKKLGERSEYVK